jgi:hypothetical protein
VRDFQKDHVTDFRPLVVSPGGRTAMARNDPRSNEA